MTLDNLCLVSTPSYYEQYKVASFIAMKTTGHDQEGNKRKIPLHMSGFLSLPENKMNDNVHIADSWVILYIHLVGNVVLYSKPFPFMNLVFFTSAGTLR